MPAPSRPARAGLLAPVLVSVLAGAPPATAQTLDCDNPQNQHAINACAHQDWQKADRELNATWKIVKARIDALDLNEPGHAKALLKAQRVWITYRDAQCELEGWQAHGGTMEPMLVSSCMERLTQIRTRELRELAGLR